MVSELRVRLRGPKLLQPVVHYDDRGFFLETYRRADYSALGVEDEWVQENHSRSAGGTLRGLHFQSYPGQAKLVRVARGSAFDVVVDLRRSSPTFGEWEAFELDDDRHLRALHSCRLCARVLRPHGPGGLRLQGWQLLYVCDRAGNRVERPGNCSPVADNRSGRFGTGSDEPAAGGGRGVAP